MRIHCGFYPKEVMILNSNDLDEEFIKKLTDENIQQIFDDLITRKTNLLDGKIMIAKGVDGIDYLTFKKDIIIHTDIIRSKGTLGKYTFKPFKEITVPKAPFEKDQLAEAKIVGKIRVLSVSTIQDTIFQEIISQVIRPFAEKKFTDSMDLNSFAYRKNKSSKMAVQEIRKYIAQGYMHVLDGDIEKFFDKIDHTLLMQKCELFFGKENKLIQKYIYRFMNVARIPDGKLREFKKSKGKNGIEKRLLGIPQGGVISGLLANIFLYDFDLYIINNLSKIYDFKYIRYADDFVLLFRESKDIETVYNKLKSFLEDEKLTLHKIGEKTKIIDLTLKNQGILEFLGFTISPRYLRVKESNVKKFYHRIEEILKEISAKDTKKYLRNVVLKIKPKIIGLEDMLTENGFCSECHQLLQKRSWIGYFISIDDVRLLRNMDTTIRKMIYHDYFEKTKQHLKKKELLEIKDKLPSLEKMYYTYKKQEKLVRTGKISYCKCIRYFDKEKNEIVVSAPEQIQNDVAESTMENIVGKKNNDEIVFELNSI